MSRYDEPTQRVRAPQPPVAPLPGSLDPLRRTEQPPQEIETGTGWVDPAAAEPQSAEETAAPTVDTGATGVLPLDQIFEEPGQPEPARMPTAAAEAPTWTAMPVVPIRSEPLAQAGAADAWSQPGDEVPAAGVRKPRANAGVAWARTRMQLEDWLRRDDNGLMLLTALVACILMIVVAGVGA